MSQKNLYHHKKHINPNTQLFDLDSFSPLLSPLLFFIFSVSCSVSSGAELERQSGPINITNDSHACINVICRYTGTLPTKGIGWKEMRKNSLVSTWQREIPVPEEIKYVPGKSKVSMNVILEMQRTIVIVLPNRMSLCWDFDFINSFYVHLYYNGHSRHFLYKFV